MLFWIWQEQGLDRFAGPLLVENAPEIECEWWCSFVEETSPWCQRFSDQRQGISIKQKTERTSFPVCQYFTKSYLGQRCLQDVFERQSSLSWKAYRLWFNWQGRFTMCKQRVSRIHRTSNLRKDCLWKARFHDINRRPAALAMRIIGRGRASLTKFCPVMNMPGPVAKTSFMRKRCRVV